MTSMEGRTPSTGRQALEEVITTVPDPLITTPSMVVPGGFSSGVSTVADSTMAVKTVDDVSAMRKPAGDVARASIRGPIGPQSNAHPGCGCQEGGNVERLHSSAKRPYKGVWKP
jgi:hypothetical protein